MADVKEESNKPIEIEIYREEDQRRVFSNYVGVSANPNEVSLKFCDLKPPANKEELETVQKEGKVKIPVTTEIVLPIEVGASLMEALGNVLKQMEEEE